MNERIDIYFKIERNWVYQESTRMFKRLVDAVKHYGPGYQARWSER